MLTVILDMTDKAAPNFLVYDNAGHLLGGVKDVTVHITASVNGEPYKSAEVSFQVNNVQIVGGAFDSIQAEPGLSYDIDNRGNATIHQHNLQYMAPVAGGRESWGTLPLVTSLIKSDVPPYDVFKAMRTVMTVDSAGYVSAQRQGARGFTDTGHWDWEDIPDDMP